MAWLFRGLVKGFLLFLSTEEKLAEEVNALAGVWLLFKRLSEYLRVFERVDMA